MGKQLLCYLHVDLVLVRVADAVLGARDLVLETEAAVPVARRAHAARARIMKLAHAEPFFHVVITRALRLKAGFAPGSSNVVV